MDNTSDRQDRLRRIETKLDSMLLHLSAVNVTLARQETQLAEHMRRTCAAEKSIKQLESNSLKYAIGIIGALGAILFEMWMRAVGK